MTITDRAARHLEALRALIDVDVDVDRLAAGVARLSDDEIRAVISESTALIRSVDTVRIAASGVLSARSRWETGHSGAAQRRGQRDAIAAVQEATGSTRAEATRQVRLGESLLAATPHVVADEAAPAEPTAAPWHDPLSQGLLAGDLSAAQHDVILRGLGEPPSDDEAWIEAWRLAAEELRREAEVRTVEDLAGAARAVRDQLDPEGAARRFDERFQARSFRLWRDREGTHRASIAFDDEMAAWVRAMLDAALRSRRGGPRFTTEEERAVAQRLIDDPRTNDQLAYDLVMDVLRVGAVADAAAVFGVRQPGVRVIVTAAALDTDRATADPRLDDDHSLLEALDVSTARSQPGPQVGRMEDGGAPVPVAFAAARLCDAGEQPVVATRAGDPLFLGRTQRLFSPKQRLAMAVRDGGCRWRGCDRPPSMCEAHHIDSYGTGGRTDIDRGLLLCRFHHMTLHANGWRITRDGCGDFLLHPPDGAPPQVLRRRIELLPRDPVRPKPRAPSFRRT